MQNLRLYRELASVLMDARDYEGLIAACQRFGDARTGAHRFSWSWKSAWRSVASCSLLLA